MVKVEWMEALRLMDEDQLRALVQVAEQELKDRRLRRIARKLEAKGVKVHG